MNNKFELGKDALIMAIMTLITILTWVGFDIYWAVKKTTIPKATQAQMAPLNPTINPKIINDLKDNLSFNEETLDIVTNPPLGENSSLLR